MRPRITLGRFLIRLGGFIQSLAIMSMRPADLVEFSRQQYARHEVIEGWASDDVLSRGLNPLEKGLLAKIPLKDGQLLLLGVGGGREAIPLAQLGYEVTGVDFVPGMLQRAQENAAKEGLKIRGLVQEISQLEVPPASFDLIWLSRSMYSTVPTRKLRLEMLQHVRRALRPGGYFICFVHWEKKRVSPKAELLRKIFALLTMGNLWYEEGDTLWGNVEFVHAFSSEAVLRSEFAEGGFEPLHLEIPESTMQGGAVLSIRN